MVLLPPCLHSQANETGEKLIYGHIASAHMLCVRYGSLLAIIVNKLTLVGGFDAYEKYYFTHRSFQILWKTNHFQNRQLDKVDYTTTINH